MINLLPQEEKQKLLLAKKEKLFIIFGIVFFVFLVCFTLILLSIKFYILAETDYQKNILQQTEKEYQTQEFVNLNNNIKKYNGILSQLDSFYAKEIYFTQALDTIKSIPSPKGLTLTNFLLSRDAKGLVQVSISGTSDSRDSLLIFKKSIEEDGSIKNPVFSADSWISPTNAKFSLTFNIDKKNNEN
jgi:hypothetical protein